MAGKGKGDGVCRTPDLVQAPKRKKRRYQFLLLRRIIRHLLLFGGI